MFITFNWFAIHFSHSQLNDFLCLQCTLCINAKVQFFFVRNYAQFCFMTKSYFGKLTFNFANCEIEYFLVFSKDSSLMVLQNPVQILYCLWSLLVKFGCVWCCLILRFIEYRYCMCLTPKEIREIGLSDGNRFHIFWICLRLLWRIAIAALNKSSDWTMVMQNCECTHSWVIGIFELMKIIAKSTVMFNIFKGIPLLFPYGCMKN